MKSFCTDTLAKDGWLPVCRPNQSARLWNHPDFKNVFASLGSDGEIHFHYQYRIENSYHDDYSWGTLEIPDCLIGRISISEVNLAGEGLSPDGIQNHLYTKYYFINFRN